MRLKFVSGDKFLEFDGSGERAASVISVSGFEGVTKEYQTVRYVSVPGQVTVSENVLPREIVICGDICTKNSMPFSDYCIFFADSGELYVSKGTSRKKIAYKPIYFKQTGKKGDFVLFELKIMCDFPYFSDAVNNNIDIYKRTDMVTDEFYLPKVFTVRITRADVINKGQVEAEPVIVLECMSSGDYSGGIHIKNTSTGKSLILTTNMIEGEKIVFDVKGRRISSNKRQNCYGILDQNCTLADFFLKKGVNEIVIDNKNDGETVNATLYFENLYTEAM